MARKVSDEKLLEMLLVHGGVSGAASALGISKVTVYQRLQDPVFRGQYDAAQGTVVSCAAAALSDALETAIGCLVSVVKDTEVSPGIRVQASNALLTHANRYIETSNILRRLDALEAEHNERH